MCQQAPCQTIKESLQGLEVNAKQTLSTLSQKEVQDTCRDPMLSQPEDL